MNKRSRYALPLGVFVGIYLEISKYEVHYDVIKWKHFPRYWPFVRAIHWSPVNSPHKGQWRGALMFSLICTWMNVWVNNDEAGDLRHHPAHYDVTVMNCSTSLTSCKIGGSEMKIWINIHKSYHLSLNRLQGLCASRISDLITVIWVGKLQYHIFIYFVIPLSCLIILLNTSKDRISCTGHAPYKSINLD